jgi:hypothetical protein
MRAYSPSFPPKATPAAPRMTAAALLPTTGSLAMSEFAVETSFAYPGNCFDRHQPRPVSLEIAGEPLSSKNSINGLLKLAALN